MQDSSTASDVVIGPSYDAFKKHGMYMKCYNEFLSKCYCSLHESEYLVADMIVETMAHIQRYSMIHISWRLMERKYV